jgi:hypothetical protein
MGIIDQEGRFIPDDSMTEVADLGNVDGIMVRGESFDFEAVRVFRTFAHRRDEFPTEIRADWKNVQWVDAEGEVALTIPSCFIDSAPVTFASDRRQPAAITWGDLMERALIDLAEKTGRWY